MASNMTLGEDCAETLGKTDNTGVVHCEMAKVKGVRCCVMERPWWKSTAGEYTISVVLPGLRFYRRGYE